MIEVGKDWLVQMGILLESIDLAGDIVMRIMELHGFTDSAKSSFDVAETHMQIRTLAEMGSMLIQMVADDSGFNDYHKLVEVRLQELKDKAHATVG